MRHSDCALAAGVAHNDIKPDNVLLRFSGGWSAWTAAGRSNPAWSGKVK